jgi:hypothetical protein
MTESLSQIFISTLLANNLVLAMCNWWKWC